MEEPAYVGLKKSHATVSQVLQASVVTPVSVVRILRNVLLDQTLRRLATVWIVSTVEYASKSVDKPFVGALMTGPVLAVKIIVVAIMPAKPCASTAVFAYQLRH